MCRQSSDFESQFTDRRAHQPDKGSVFHPPRSKRVIGLASMPHPPF